MTWEVQYRIENDMGSGKGRITTCYNFANTFLILCSSPLLKQVYIENKNGHMATDFCQVFVPTRPFARRYCDYVGMVDNLVSSVCRGRR